MPVPQRNYTKALYSPQIKTGKYTEDNHLYIKDECKRIVGVPKDKIWNGKTK